MDEAHFLVFDDDECDVFIESYDVDAFVIFCDVINVILVGGVGFYFECGAVIHEGADDVLRGLLSYFDAVDVESSIAHDDGDEVATGDFTFARSSGGAVEIPRMTQPAAHHFWKCVF